MIAFVCGVIVGVLASVALLGFYLAVMLAKIGGDE